jgi:ribosomal protein S12 methylthiotransferase
VPELTLRSSFVVGFPGETEEDFQYLLDWLVEASLDRVGCFRYEPVTGAAANALPDAVPPEVTEERWHRFMAAQQAISARRLREKVGRTIGIIADSSDAEGVVARSTGDAPEIDGKVFLPADSTIRPGDRLEAIVESADEYDLWARPAAARGTRRRSPAGRY